MNFDTRTLLDVITLDKSFEREIENRILEEKKLWSKTGKTSNNDFVQSIIPIIKDEIKNSIKSTLYKEQLLFLSSYIDLDNVDFYHLIPTLASI